VCDSPGNCAKPCAGIARSPPAVPQALFCFVTSQTVRCQLLSRVIHRIPGVGSGRPGCSMHRHVRLGEGRTHESVLRTEDTDAEVRAPPRYTWQCSCGAIAIWLRWKQQSSNTGVRTGGIGRNAKSPSNCPFGARLRKDTITQTLIGAASSHPGPGCRNQPRERCSRS
jgi:hypothetical protein